MRVAEHGAGDVAPVTKGRNQPLAVELGRLELPEVPGIAATSMIMSGGREGRRETVKSGSTSFLRSASSMTVQTSSRFLRARSSNLLL